MRLGTEATTNKKGPETLARGPKHRGLQPLCNEGRCCVQAEEACCYSPSRQTPRLHVDENIAPHMQLMSLCGPTPTAFPLVLGQDSPICA